MTGFSLKDHLFNRDKVTYLASLLAAHDPDFPQRRFVNEVTKKFPELELKQRIAWMAECLERHLPPPFPDAVAQLVKSLPPPLDPSKSDDDFGDFIFAPLGEYVVRQGLVRDHFAHSFQALYELTQRFSMEDAMRAFLRQFPKETLRQLARWVRDPNYHVRRLVSESTRPLLPWSGRIDLTPEQTLPLLDILHADPTRYVTRSVANHLNDLAKSHPELVIETLTRWHSKARQKPEELTWMTRHALRTLIKRGDADALKLLGFHPAPQVTVRQLRLASSRLKPGDTLEFSMEIQAKRDESLVLDYAIDFVKAGGKRSVKVYKGAKLHLQQGEKQTVSKKHKLHAHATTYQLYPGEHYLSIQINGEVVGTLSFMIL